MADGWWDASLAGAASGLALAAVAGTGGLEGWEVREAAWEAGWPYTITEARGWSTAAGAAPPADLREWAAAEPDRPAGVVRARGARGDAWVALRAGVPRADLGVVPRTFPAGATLTIPAAPGATFAVADPEGRLWEGGLDLPRPIALTTAGEWMVELADAGGLVARFPVYVDVRVPDHPLLTRAEAGAEPLAHAMALLDDARAAFAMTPWRRDPLLDSVARAIAGGRDDVGELAAAVGFSATTAHSWTCSDGSVEGCIEPWLFEARRRPVLLGPTTHVGATGVRTREGHVRLTIVVASS